MYSGTTFHNYSGNFVGAHQKINRSSRRLLAKTVNAKHFPDKKLLLHFEGKNGPDGIKSKSPAQNEPWHFYDPFDPDDDQLVYTILDHYRNLVTELKKDNQERAAFEAAWLSHAIVDGLTPAHHYPYEEELATLRKGEGNETRNTLKEKVLMKGDKPSEIVKNNWKAWGIGGLISTHSTFELGVAAIMAPLTFKDVSLTQDDLQEAKRIGIEQVFERSARKIALWNLYDEYGSYGWTVGLARKVRDKLAPELIHTVALGWYLALNEAGYAAKLKKS